MSLSVAGVWQVGVWDQTVWADGVWREGAAAPSEGTSAGGGKVQRARRSRGRGKTTGIFMPAPSRKEARRRVQSERMAELTPPPAPIVPGSFLDNVLGQEEKAIVDRLLAAEAEERASTAQTIADEIRRAGKLISDKKQQDALTQRILFVFMMLYLLFLD